MSNISSIPAEIRKADWKAIGLIFLITLVLGLPTLAYPFGRDQGQYAWIASSTLHGNLAYRDIFEIKPPLTYMVHELALLLFGQHMASIRLLDLLWQFMTAVLLYKIAVRLEQSQSAGILGAILYLVFYFHPDYWTNAQTDGFLNLPIAAGILFFLIAQQRASSRSYFASGAAISLGVLFKYPIGILILFLCLLEFIRLKKNGLLPALWLMTGFGTPLLIGALVMFMRGNLTDFLWAQFVYIPRYSTILHDHLSYVGGLTFGLGGIMKAPLPGWVSLIGICGLFIGPSRSRRTQMVILVMWWASAVIHFLIQNKFYIYHALPIYAPLALMVSNFFVDISKKGGLARFTMGAFGAFLLAFPFFSYDFPARYARVVQVVTGAHTLENVYSAEIFNNGDDSSIRADMEVAKYLRANTNQDERVFVWGFEPAIYFLSQRQNATRFIYNITLYGPNASPESQQEFLGAIREQNPVYVVIVRNDAITHVTATSEDSWAAFNAWVDFHDFVTKNYRLETTIENFVIYRLEQ